MQSHAFTLNAEQFRPVPLTELDFPDSFTSTLFHQVDDNLCTRVQQCGQLQPLPVQQVGDHSYHVLAGYAYLPVLRQLGYQEIICHVVQEIPDYSRFILQISHSLSTVQTSPILQGSLLKKALQVLEESEALQLLVQMGYKPQRYKLQELVALFDLSPASILALHRGYLAPKTGKLISRLSHEDQDFLVELINTYRPGGSKQQKLIEMIIELSLRHNQRIRELLEPWVALRQNDAPENLPQQLQSLLRFLHELTFPALQDAEKRFQRLAQELDLPAHVLVQHSQAFEDESVQLTIQCKDMTQLKTLWSGLSPLLSSLPRG